jgi:uncharacterized membrane protein
MGTLIGADLLRVYQIKKLGSPFMSIGGAGIFDGICLAGLVSVDCFFLSLCLYLYLRLSLYL